jgi:uncharacterized protein (DUF1499 family)
MAEGKKRSWFARAGLWLALIAALLAVASGLGSRAGWWPFGLGFRLLSWAFFVGGAAAALSAIGLFATRHGKKLGRLRAMTGFALGLVILAVPASWMWKARSVPAIHDITTDTDHPPTFSAITPLRRDAPNSMDYGGPEVAARQRTAYPDLQPALLDLSVERAFDAALVAARAMHWEIVDANPAQGRIEATDTTFWFGFKDDVAIRIVPTERGSRVDVRSLSRVGRSDVGTNAKRIRAFLATLQSRR